MPLTPGVRLGPYEIVAPLGAGGMGEVYRARDTRLDRVVALKILPESLAADPQFRDRFDREARSISQLSHPHICPLFDVGHQDGVHFLVREYLPIQTAASFSTGTPIKLFEAPAATTPPMRYYDVPRDGQKFVLIKNPPASSTTATSMVVVLNWTEELKAKIGGR